MSWLNLMSESLTIWWDYHWHQINLLFVQGPYKCLEMNLMRYTYTVTNKGVGKLRVFLCQRLQTALSCSYFNKMYSIYNDTSFELAWPLAKLSAPHQPRRGAQRVHSDNRFIHWNSKPRKIRQKARLTYFFDDFICVRQGFGSVWCLSNYHHLFFFTSYR